MDALRHGEVASTAAPPGAVRGTARALQETLWGRPGGAATGSVDLTAQHGPARPGVYCRFCSPSLPAWDSGVNQWAAVGQPVGAGLAGPP